MTLIALVYILMYLRMKKEAIQRELTSSHDSRAQMVQISRTFTVVVMAYFVCYLPHTILQIMYRYSQYTTEIISSDTFNRIVPFTNMLIFSNSCLNPIVYSKLLMKIYNAVRDVLVRCRMRIPSFWNCCRQRDRQRSSGTRPDHFEMFVIPSVGHEDRRNNTIQHGGNPVHNQKNSSELN